MSHPDMFYWCVVYHKTETRVHDYIVKLYRTQDEAIASIRRTQKDLDLGKELQDEEIYKLVEAQIPIQLNSETVVSLSTAMPPSCISWSN
ncbi:MAG: hypothetical protein WD512_05555 [Candidatus Paceibacterota bacterium]